MKQDPILQHPRHHEYVFSFPEQNTFAFYYEEMHLVLFTWKRDHAKFLYFVRAQEANVLALDYPGETFTNQVLDAIESVFFIQLEESGETTSYVLGCYFEWNGRRFGAYYPRNSETPVTVLFEMIGEGDNQELLLLEEEEFLTVSQVFKEKYGELLQIRS